MNPHISVVITVYKPEAILQKTLLALSKQSLPLHDFEVIVISRSDDFETEAMVKGFNLYSFTYYGVENINSIAAARNFGWKLSRAPIIAFTEPGVLPHKKWLEAILNHYHGEQLVVYSGNLKVPLSTDPLGVDFELSNPLPENLSALNFAATRTALELVNGFDERYLMPSTETTDLEFKFKTQGIPIIPIDDAVVILPSKMARRDSPIKTERKRMYHALLSKKFLVLYRERKYPGRIPRYLLMIMLMIASLLCLYFHQHIIAGITFGLWFILQAEMVLKRLLLRKNWSRYFIGAVAVSVAMPFVALYWQLAGSLKFRN
jgi:glycosyltransferase involved in cell wall biosynthesis